MRLKTYRDAIAVLEEEEKRLSEHPEWWQRNKGEKFHLVLGFLKRQLFQAKQEKKQQRRNRNPK